MKPANKLHLLDQVPTGDLRNRLTKLQKEKKKCTRHLRLSNGASAKWRRLYAVRDEISYIVDLIATRPVS